MSVSPPRTVLRTLHAAALVAALGLVVACGGGTSDADGAEDGPAGADGDRTLRVVATTSILGDVVQRVVGDGGEVVVLMQRGVDPHAFEPSASQAAALRDADLVVANGLELEVGLVDAMAAAESDGVEVLRVAEHVDPIPFAGTDPHGHEGEEEHADEDGNEVDDGRADESDADDDQDPLDPHFWLDPLRMADAVDVLAARIREVAPGEADAVGRNADAYREELVDLHEEIQDTLAAVPDERRLLVTNHDALGYFARRYDFALVGTVIPGGSTLAEASGRDLARLAATIEEAGVPAVFVETTTPDRLARAVSAEVEGRDVEVVTLYTGSLGEAGSEAATYVDLMRTNAARIAAALGA